MLTPQYAAPEQVTGGDTKLDNLVLLCSHHHYLLHDASSGCVLMRGEIVFTTPDGAMLPAAIPLAGLDELGESPHMLEQDLAQHAIHKDTCLPSYHGGGMDYDMALHAMAELG